VWQKKSTRRCEFLKRLKWILLRGGTAKGKLKNLDQAVKATVDMMLYVREEGADAAGKIILRFNLKVFQGNGESLTRKNQLYRAPRGIVGLSNVIG